ncbi:bifunctional 2-polyprenyl-6-hydroxyphenol methylase/3-demethylubiquinol 3-O-methyltransferase UbiG [Spiribacter vilamensis]|uniref:Ubiquinone biosynthesis O-methyltransferase n=1 Tax=Spiribacter vilamensis TaxID=531306 RepID=A0A4V2GJ40_9GAMM|nr:bifunctional 2-polyprenyl-6-hydroxyphenol methylase/3-demethylubiquinol 3-O-methyltransferase UbiG [Spiribacter vilamensis]RZU98825.1 3-demethylubiquinone-9 3-methyltransferase [Spiribacter vilamensis]TVO62155.1 bifunctional 2-polyprenyl-6-hydroxyphenol methylase/3-demethylubiquinol 3-O-methyltransferase UbiG [Spiribacter vilamensis]
MREQNADPDEIARFDRDANDWWDPQGPFAPLHAINPLRLDYIEQCGGPIRGRRIVDVGCGGGLLAEGLAERGAARVDGIDLAPETIEVARQHARDRYPAIDYQAVSAESFAASHAGMFDTVTCLELLEHVPDPASVIQACATLVRPGGSVFFSTINRNTRAWLFAVVAAEQVLGLLPKGTHNAKAFIQPAELGRWARQAGLDLQDLTGLHYHPVTRHYTLGGNTRVNYLAHCRRPEAA